MIFGPILLEKSFLKTGFMRGGGASITIWSHWDVFSFVRMQFRHRVDKYLLVIVVQHRGC